MIDNNPYLMHLDRSPYELGCLVGIMPQFMPRDRAFTVDELQMSEAVKVHAGIALDNIEHGLEALGAVMFAASESKDYPMDSRHVGALGILIKHLAVESQFVRSRLDSAVQDLSDQEVQRASAPPARKGAPA